jgi:hypothetical protein
MCNNQTLVFTLTTQLWANLMGYIVAMSGAFSSPKKKRKKKVVSLPFGLVPT